MLMGNSTLLGKPHNSSQLFVMTIAAYRVMPVLSLWFRHSGCLSTFVVWIEKDLRCEGHPGQQHDGGYRESVRPCRQTATSQNVLVWFDDGSSNQNHPLQKLAVRHHSISGGMASKHAEC